jgi:hypothetical protein
VLPHIEHEQRDRPDGNVALLVVELLDDDVSAERLVGENRPAGALEADGGGVEVAAEALEGTEGVVECGCQLTGREIAAVRGEVLPEDRVVGVAAEVEGEVLGSFGMFPNSPFSRASASCASASLAPLT